MEMNEFKGLLVRLFDGQELSNDELASLDYQASILLDKMENGTIEYEDQMALDEYISYYDDSRYLDPTKTSNVMRYYRIIEDKRNVKEKESQNNKPYVIRPVSNKKGVIAGLAIIEAVVILGILISFLAIVLMQK